VRGYESVAERPQDARSGLLHVAESVVPIVGIRLTGGGAVAHVAMPGSGFARDSSQRAHVCCGSRFPFEDRAVQRLTESTLEPKTPEPLGLLCCASRQWQVRSRRLATPEQLASQLHRYVITLFPHPSRQATSCPKALVNRRFSPALPTPDWPSAPWQLPNCIQKEYTRAPSPDIPGPEHRSTQAGERFDGQHDRAG
jgi:hypothetical protein